MSTLQISCFLYFVCNCPTSPKPLWSLPKYSYATGPVLVTQLPKGSRQEIYRLKLNNNQETPWQPHEAVTWCAGAQGEERLKSCGEACGSSWPPQEPAATTLKGSSGCYGQGDTEIHPPTETETGRRQSSPGLWPQNSGRRALGKRKLRQIRRCRGTHGWLFGSVTPFCSVHTHEFEHPPSTGQLITQRTAAVVPAKLRPAAGSGKQRCCTSFHGNQNQRSWFPPKSH